MVADAVGRRTGPRGPRFAPERGPRAHHRGFCSTAGLGVSIPPSMARQRDDEQTTARRMGIGSRLLLLLAIPLTALLVVTGYGVYLGATRRAGRGRIDRTHRPGPGVVRPGRGPPGRAGVARRGGPHLSRAAQRGAGVLRRPRPSGRCGRRTAAGRDRRRPGSCRRCGEHRRTRAGRRRGPAGVLRRRRGAARPVDRRRSTHGAPSTTPRPPRPTTWHAPRPPPPRSGTW